MLKVMATIAALGLAALATPMAQAQTVDSVSKVDAKQMQINKKNVVEFYNAALNEKDFEKASKYLGATYIQHNPVAADGPEGLKGFIAFLRDKFPNNKSEIKRVLAEGNYVIVHVHAVREPGTRGNAIIDIFRLDDNGKVVEHWDAVQPIPEKAANNNGMF
jgi:predicted SnoaL-like aldol condensation-catalyzing enzyme